MRTSFHTSLGWMSLATAGRQVLGLVFGHPSEVASGRALQALITERVCSTYWDRIDCEKTADKNLANVVQQKLVQFAAGEPTDFTSIPVATADDTLFQRQVINACRAIPWGENVTYGQLAARVGHPGAARAVGTVMAHNRVPLIVPCHRVLASNGRLGGYSAPGGLATKRRLLSAEQFACVSP